MEYKTDCRFYEDKSRPYCKWHQSNILPKHCNPCVYFQTRKPTEEDYKGEDAEVIRMNERANNEYSEKNLAELLGAEASLPKDIIDKLIEKPYKE